MSEEPKKTAPLAPLPIEVELDFSKTSELPSVSSSSSDRSLTVVGPDGETVVVVRFPKNQEARLAMADLVRKHIADAAAGVWL